MGSHCRSVSQGALIHGFDARSVVMAMSGAYPNRGKYIKTIRGSVSRMELVVEVGGVTIPGRSYETKYLLAKNSLK